MVSFFSNSLLFGAFEKEKDVVIRQDWSLKGMPERPTLEPHFERVEEPYQKVCDLLPCLKGAPVDPKAVAFTMTPDCFPLVGPIEGVPRFWLQAGYFDGVTTAGGIGKYVADWIIDGEPPHELFDTDANRYARWADKKFLIARTKESYSMFYNWAYEDRPAGRPTGRVSGVYGSLVRDGAHMAFRTGWEVPASFSLGDEGYMRALMREYQMVTNKCGIVDLSWKGKIEVRGPEASALLSYVFSNEPPPIRHINTALMLTRSGRILAPLKVLHHDQNRSEFILLSDPEREIRDYGWIKSAAKEMNFKVEISPVSEYLASLALIGPNSRSVLAELTKTDVSDKGFPRGSTKLMRLANVPVIAAQSSATGELGYELFHNRADSLKLYQAIMREGAAYGIANFGLATLNALRMEQGFKLWGREITLDTNPYEVGLGNLVDLNKKDFIGKTSAIELSKKKYDRRQVLLQLDATASAERICDVRQVPQGMEVVRREGKEERIGQITSGCFSVKLQRPLCFAWISNDVKDSETLVVDLGNQRIPAQILDKPPAQPKVEGATSASI
uniref:Dimethylglycine dehydrogenase n=1 Tax=Plectus sambesii TaxID=2011161 RepID=A0A914VTZ0_9BILA